jgi:hypothetical protein
VFSFVLKECSNENSYLILSGGAELFKGLSDSMSEIRFFSKHVASVYVSHSTNILTVSAPHVVVTCVQICVSILKLADGIPGWRGCIPVLPMFFSMEIWKFILIVRSLLTCSLGYISILCVMKPVLNLIFIFMQCYVMDSRGENLNTEEPFPISSLIYGVI